MSETSTVRAAHRDRQQLVEHAMKPHRAETIDADC